MEVWYMLIPWRTPDTKESLRRDKRGVLEYRITINRAMRKRCHLSESGLSKHLHLLRNRTSSQAVNMMEDCQSAAFLGGVEPTLRNSLNRTTGGFIAIPRCNRGLRPTTSHCYFDVTQIF